MKELAGSAVPLVGGVLVANDRGGGFPRRAAGPFLGSPFVQRVRCPSGPSNTGRNQRYCFIRA
jgi:hypothetical protein